MHDIVTLETRGIPGVLVASSEFREAAAAQGHALGFEPAAIFVRHPIQDRTDDEMRAIADEAMDRIMRALTAQTTD